MIRARTFGFLAALGLIGLVSAATVQAQGQPQAAPRAGGGVQAPKRLLVVSVTAGFRHDSIEVGEKVLRDLARRSGDFTLDFASVNPRDPKYALAEGERKESGRRGGFGPGMILAGPIVTQGDKNGDKTLSKREFEALANAWFDKLDPDGAGKVDRDRFLARFGEVLPMLSRPGPDAAAPKPKRRRTAPPVNLSGLVGPGLFTALDTDKDGVITRDELRAAYGQWATDWDTDKDGTVNEAEVRAGLNAALPRPPIVGFERNPRADAAGREVLAEIMSPEALEKYDGVIFLNTTGDLPISDPGAFYRWVEDGHAFIGMHAAADTLHGDPRYARMLGAEFATHGAQVEVNVLNADPRHPATAALGRSLNVFEEIYLFKNYDRSKVHLLLEMNEHPNTEEPGHYPVSWTRDQGKGRVFYTSLGHREDVWDPAWKDRDGKRENPPEVVEAYQQHILGGIRWALGLVEAGETLRAADGKGTP